MDTKKSYTKDELCALVDEWVEADRENRNAIIRLADANDKDAVFTQLHYCNMKNLADFLITLLCDKSIVADDRIGLTRLMLATVFYCGYKNLGKEETLSLLLYAKSKLSAELQEESKETEQTNQPLNNGQQ